MNSAEPAACATAELSVTRVVPTVWLMVDGSGSMSAPLDLLDVAGASRWTLLRDALLADGSGLVPRLQQAIAFGLYVYDGGLSLPGIPGPQCPRTLVVDPSVNGAAAVSGMYPELETGASTPTHDALLDLKSRIDAAGPRAEGPSYVVLATDGKPNLCDFHDGIPATPDTEQEAVETVRQLAAAGTQVFVISMAGDDSDLQTHLQAVAAAGGTGKQPFVPASQNELVQALTEILGAAASCDVRIQGKVEAGRECTGTVSLDGRPLVCNDANGYRLKDDRASLELLGTACSTLQAAAAPVVKARFPCADVTLL
ncbi:MAG: vWA domain-containing protein [Polyangiales bacterium]